MQKFDAAFAACRVVEADIGFSSFRDMSSQSLAYAMLLGDVGLDHFARIDDAVELGLGDEAELQRGGLSVRSLSIA